MRGKPQTWQSCVMKKPPETQENSCQAAIEAITFLINKKRVPNSPSPPVKIEIENKNKESE
jgi:hypothetical protein